MTSAVVAASPANVLAGLAGSAGAFSLAWVGDSADAVPPTDGTTALDSSFVDLGIVTQDGATTGTNITSTDILAFGSYQPVRSLIQGEEITVHFVAQETNAVTAAIKTRQALSAVVVTTGHKLALTRGPGRDTKYALVIDALDGTNHIRKFYPAARLTALGDQQVGFGAAIVYDFTFTAYPDDDGVSEYEYIVNTNLVVPA
jgi:hypothetical protein